MIHIESRNEDGIRVIHDFPSADAMLADMNSDAPSMGDNHILLVTVDGAVIFSSLGRVERFYDDTVRTADVQAWFEKVELVEAG